MTKQGIIVVSHPRSGSSEFVRTLAHFAAETLSPDKTVGVLAECFHWADASVFGNLPRLNVLSRDNKLQYPCDETVMVPHNELPTIDTGDRIGWQNYFFKHVERRFTSQTDIKDFYISQYQERIDFVNHRVVEKSFPIIKSFLGFEEFRGDDNKQLLQLQQTLVSRLTNIEPIFFYRKNLLDSIYSDLIKWLYIDRPRIKTDEKLDGFAGHNFNNTMPPLKPRAGVFIEGDIINQFPEVFCLTLKNFQMNRHFFKNIVSYDQVFVDKKFNLQWGNTVYEVTEHTNEHREYPMNYQAPKRDYFENPDAVIDVIDQTITRHGLWDLIDELGITVK